jgi:hypothetical protein
VAEGGPAAGGDRQSNAIPGQPPAEGQPKPLIRVNTAEAARRIFKNADANRDGTLSDAEATRAVKQVERLVEDSARRALGHRNVTIREVFQNRAMPSLGGNAAVAELERFAASLAEGADASVREIIKQRIAAQSGVLDPRLERARREQLARDRQRAELEQLERLRRQRDQRRPQELQRDGKRRDAGKRTGPPG